MKGAQNVYAIGDCATIDQRKIMVCEAITAWLYLSASSVWQYDFDKSIFVQQYNIYQIWLMFLKI